MHLALFAGTDVAQLRTTYPLERTIYRSDGRKYMVTYHRYSASEKLAALKGSPAEVMQLCRWTLEAGALLPLDDARRDRLPTHNDAMAADALCVLAFAYALFPTDAAKPEGYVWLGLAGLADPLRPGVAGVIRDFHKAGIDTVMITGDQSATAHAIGRELGISARGPIEILDSTHLENIDPVALRGIVRRVNVFSRVSPTHKLQIVQSLQDAGRVVAMTGNGINDSPALKAADIGVAMGRSGTDVAREVADVILEDDNLETMIVAIRQLRQHPQIDPLPAFDQHQRDRRDVPLPRRRCRAAAQCDAAALDQPPDRCRPPAWPWPSSRSNPTSSTALPETPRSRSSSAATSGASGSNRG